MASESRRTERGELETLTECLLFYKYSLSTSSLIEPSYQVSATIFNKVFFPQNKSIFLISLCEEETYIDRVPYFH